MDRSNSRCFPRERVSPLSLVLIHGCSVETVSADSTVYEQRGGCHGVPSRQERIGGWVG